MPFNFLAEKGFSINQKLQVGLLHFFFKNLPFSSVSRLFWYHIYIYLIFIISVVVLFHKYRAFNGSQKASVLKKPITTWNLRPSLVILDVSGKFPFNSNPSLVTNTVVYLQQNKTSTEDKYTSSYEKASVYVGVCTAKTRVEAPFLVFHHASVLLAFWCCRHIKSNSNKLMNVSICLERCIQAQY